MRRPRAVVAVLGDLGDAVAGDLGTGQLVGGVPAQLGVAVLLAALVALDAARQVSMRVVFKMQVLVKAQSVIGHPLAGAGWRLRCCGLVWRGPWSPDLSQKPLDAFLRIADKGLQNLSLHNWTQS